ncbi:unnamed protein product [Cuscuta campestris]|uniref:Uncharacterized protein n=1 Tax=Cuscuta campestris TaxID=132261 RepID=A0A484KNI7_9ASTE|nr:unnamed protein product [Cuscuta campestris]
MVASESLKGQLLPTTAKSSSSVSIGKMAEQLARLSGTEGEKMSEGPIFWMRDPRSGNWIPETHHFDEMDSVDLRDKLLPRKRPQ